MTNTHLNIHQPYSQANNAKENNYSRGLALCLMHDPVFLQTFMIKILGKLPESLTKDSIQINIQQGLAGQASTPCLGRCVANDGNQPAV